MADNSCTYPLNFSCGIIHSQRDFPTVEMLRFDHQVSSRGLDWVDSHQIKTSSESLCNGLESVSLLICFDLDLVITRSRVTKPLPL